MDRKNEKEKERGIRHATKAEGIEMGMFQL